MSSYTLFKGEKYIEKLAFGKLALGKFALGKLTRWKNRLPSFNVNNNLTYVTKSNEFL
uniref:Uncharacterized protein n=1 Tax=Lepeophtheirus salmonis TaxID=72036 RepID=A0A0K2U817_LEPSM